METRMDDMNHILKKGEGFRIVNGKRTYYFRYTDLSKKRITLYDKDLKNLRIRAKEVQQKMDTHYRVSSYLRLNDLYNMWFKTQMDSNDNEIQKKAIVYKTFAYPKFGLNKIQLLSRKDILEYYMYLFSHRNVKAEIIEELDRVLSEIFTIAVSEEYMYSDLTLDLLNDFKSIFGLVKKRRIVLTAEEQEAFEQCLSEDCNKNFQPIFLAILYAGLTVGEVTGLRWRNIDFDNNVITITHSLVYCDNKKNKKDKTYFIKDKRETNSIRKVEMSEKLRKVLLEHKNYQKENNIYCSRELNEFDDFVFVNRYRDVYNQSVLNKDLRRIQKDHNFKVISSKDNKKKTLLPIISCHMLRHTITARMYENKVPLEDIMVFLGHSNIKTTIKYCRKMEEHLNIVQLEQGKNKY